MSGNGPAVQLLDDLLRIRALNLVTVRNAGNRFAHGASRRPIVVEDLHVVSAGFGMKLDPVGRRRAPHKNQPVLFEVEENAVADHVAAVAAGNELLGSVDRELREAVDRKMGEHLDGIGAFNVDVHHVMRTGRKERTSRARPAVRPANLRIREGRPDRYRPRFANCATCRRDSRPYLTCPANFADSSAPILLLLTTASRSQTDILDENRWDGKWSAGVGGSSFGPRIRAEGMHS